MADYIYIDNYAKKGKIAISQTVFDTLAATALSNIPGISLSSAHMKKDQKVRLNRPVQTSIRHGIVHVWVAVDVVKGTNLQIVTRDIQEEIANVFLMAQNKFHLTCKSKSFLLFNQQFFFYGKNLT